MVKDYRWFSYRPEYSYKIYYRQKIVGQGDILYGQAFCFRQVFEFFRRRRAVYTGIYELKCRKKFKPQSGNYCSLDKTNIYKILRYMRNSLDVDVKFQETNDKYIFTFTIVGKPTKHKWILTFSRVFYEWPYNEMAVDVFRMRENKFIGDVDISHKSFLELYNLTFSAFSNYFGEQQSLFEIPHIKLDSNMLKEAFDKNISVQNVCFNSYGYKLRKLLIKDNSYSYETKDLDETFNNRMSIYSANFKIIKQFKQDEKKQKSIRRRTSKVIR